MTDTQERGLHPGAAFGSVFYRHAMRTAAMVLAAFALVGGTAVGITYSDGGFDPSYAVVSFLAWGMLGAAAVLALRRPPFNV